tara:strand:+ start:27301 stop:27582 length:282 start_codon:yes stop_codon:yes gene_type:complete
MDVISPQELAQVRKLGYEDNITYCKVFNWFRIKWGYTSWIEKSGKEYNYKIYAKGTYHKPIYTECNSSYCKNYEDAQSKLLNELILIVDEIEK